MVGVLRDRLSSPGNTVFHPATRFPPVINTHPNPHLAGVQDAAAWQRALRGITGGADLVVAVTLRRVDAVLEVLILPPWLQVRRGRACLR
jgi:hypothetical protein